MSRPLAVGAGSSSSAARLAGLYDSLSRYQWWRRCLSRAGPGDALEMHKRLRAPVEDSGPGEGV